MKNLILILLILTSLLTFSQQNTNAISYNQLKPINLNFNFSYPAKEWSKDKALFRCKEFLFKKVLGVSSVVQKFSVTPLASAKSDELTTLIYKSDNLNKSGLILGFYGNYWNDNGVTFQGYGFKNLNKEKAIQFLDKIQKTMDDNKKFLQSNNDNNNIFFEFEDMQVLIYRDGNFIIRVFWNGFDSTWENTAFRRSKKRFERKI